MENIIVAAIIIIAVGSIGYHLFKTAKSKNGCGSCTGCGPTLPKK